MKKLLLLLFSAFSLIVSCKKKTPEPFKGYLRMNINGAMLDYSKNANATRPNPASNYIKISGFCTDGNFGSFGIEFPNAVLGETKITDNFYSLRFTLYGIDNTNYYAGDGGISGGVIGSGKISMLELSNEYVKGTFDFITGPDGVTNAQKAVSNGEFHLKRE